MGQQEGHNGFICTNLKAFHQGILITILSNLALLVLEGLIKMQKSDG